MSLLCRNSNVLRSSDIDVSGKISLKNSDSITSNVIDISSQLMAKQENIEKKIEEAQSKYTQIVKEVEKVKTKTIEEAIDKANEIEKKAYEKGHEQGLKNGYEDGYKEAYEKNIKKARRESQEILEKADETLIYAQNQILEFLKDSKSEILKLSITIAEKVLREKFKDEKVMENMLIDIIKEYELRKSIVIKVNPIYVESFQNSIKEWKRTLNIKDEIFIVLDCDIEMGNAIIESANGKLLVGIDSILDRVKAELL